MAVTAQVAKVYRDGNRRWFGLDTACRAKAKAIIRRHCQCDDGDYDGLGGTPGYTCHNHEDGRYWPLVEKLAARIKREYLRSNKP